MARKPNSPRNASSGAKPETSPSSAPAPAEKDPAPAKEAAKPEEARSRKHLMAGAAIGVGSAALVAALLYANRGRRNDKT